MILKRTTVHRGYLTVDHLQLRLPDGSTAEREVERHGDAVAVLPYDRKRRCALLTHLFRAPVFQETGQEMLEEACAGMIAPHDLDANATARREAHEELGVNLRELHLVARVWSTPGVSTERIALFLAPYSLDDRISHGGGAPGEHEGITVMERSLAQLIAAAENHGIADSKLLTLLLALRIREPDLFIAV